MSQYTTPGALIAALKEEDQDFEFYPTTNEIIGAMVKDLRAIEYTTEEVGERRYRHTTHREYNSLLDVGAGHGATLTKIRDTYRRSADREGRDASFDRLYAIEKSTILCEQLDPSIFIVGTDFTEQSLLSKQVDVIFSNPPYSVFADWSVKILREAAAPLVYLVIPDRWEKSPAILDALAYRQAKAQIVGHYDFENAERRARAHVHLLRIELAKDKDDAFSRFFDAEFADLKAKWADDTDREKTNKARESKEEKEEREKRGRFGHLVIGPTYPEAMVALYMDEIATIRRNYSLVGTLDRELMSELGISPAKIMGCLKARLDGLKNVYWKEIFNHLSAITDRLTSKNRQSLLNTLNSYCHVDFTLGNIHAVVIWVLKNANGYLDSQLIAVFEQMVDKANVRLYKSNTRAFVQDYWRYQQERDKCTHYCLEYRLVLHWMGGVAVRWSYGKPELGETAAEFLGDLLTVARNLGFHCNTADSRINYGRRDGWTPGKPEYFYGSLPTWEKDDILFEVKGFKNGNIHMRMHQRLALALNVEYGRLKGWLRSGEEAAKETGEAEAAEHFRSYLTLPTSASNLMQLMAPGETIAEEPEPNVEYVCADCGRSFGTDGEARDDHYLSPDCPKAGESEEDEPEPAEDDLAGKFALTAAEFQARLHAISEEGGLPVLEVYAHWRDYCAKQGDMSCIVDEFRDWWAKKLGIQTRSEKLMAELAEGRKQFDEELPERLTAEEFIALADDAPQLGIAARWADNVTVGNNFSADRIGTPEGRRQIHRVYLRYKFNSDSTPLSLAVLRSHLLDDAPPSVTAHDWFAREVAKREAAADSSHDAPLEVVSTAPVSDCDTSTSTDDDTSMKKFDPFAARATTVETPTGTTPAKAKASAKKRGTAVAETGDFKQAATLLHAHTGHTGDFYRLMGPAYKATRAEIMRALMGRRIPQAECGLTVLRDLFYQHVGVPAWNCTCEADRQAKFALWLGDYLAGKAPAENAPMPERPADYAAEPKHGKAGHVSLTQPTSALARAAAAVPVATYAVMLKQRIPHETATPEIAKRDFVAWCDTLVHRTFPDWRAAWAAWLTPLVAPSEETAPVEAEDDAPVIEGFINDPEEAQPDSKVVPFVLPPEPAAKAFDPVAAALASLR